MDKVKDWATGFRQKKGFFGRAHSPQDLRKDRIGMVIESTLEASIEDVHTGGIEQGGPRYVKALLNVCLCETANARSCTS